MKRRIAIWIGLSISLIVAGAMLSGFAAREQQYSRLRLHLPLRQLGVTDLLVARDGASDWLAPIYALIVPGLLAIGVVFVLRHRRRLLAAGASVLVLIAVSVPVGLLGEASRHHAGIASQVRGARTNEHLTPLPVFANGDVVLAYAVSQGQAQVVTVAAGSSMPVTCVPQEARTAPGPRGAAPCIGVPAVPGASTDCAGSTSDTCGAIAESGGPADTGTSPPTGVDVGVPTDEAGTPSPPTDATTVVGGIGKSDSIRRYAFSATLLLRNSHLVVQLTPQSADSPLPPTIRWSRTGTTSAPRPDSATGTACGGALAEVKVVPAAAGQPIEIALPGTYRVGSLQRQDLREVDIQVPGRGRWGSSECIVLTVDPATIRSLNAGMISFQRDCIDPLHATAQELQSLTDQSFSDAQCGKRAHELMDLSFAPVSKRVRDLQQCLDSHGVHVAERTLAPNWTVLPLGNLSRTTAGAEAMFDCQFAGVPSDEALDSQPDGISWPVYWGWSR